MTGEVGKEEGEPGFRGKEKEVEDRRISGGPLTGSGMRLPGIGRGRLRRTVGRPEKDGRWWEREWAQASSARSIPLFPEESPPPGPHSPCAPPSGQRAERRAVKGGETGEEDTIPPTLEGSRLIPPHPLERRGDEARNSHAGTLFPPGPPSYKGTEPEGRERSAQGRG